MAFSFPATFTVNAQNFGVGIADDLPIGSTFLGNVQMNWFTLVHFLRVANDGTLTFDFTSFKNALADPIQIDEGATFTIPSSEIYIVPVDQPSISNVPITTILAYYSIAT